MLILQSVGSPRDQKNLFAQFEPETHTWLVSDLRSKLDLNRSLLANRQFISGESVLRASELWKLLLSRTRPDLQFVSREFALALIGQKLPTFDEAWLNSPGAPQTAYDYISQLMPVLAHPEGESIMQEWLTLNVQSQVRWGRWFDLALKLWREFLEDGLVAPPWALGVLVNEVDLNTVWSRPLIVDLGAELNQVEADLLILLAGTVDVVVLCPEPDWKDEYSKALKPYEIFESKIKIERRPPPMSGFDDARENFPEYTSEVTPSARPDRSVAKTEYFKYTTMIAEVKDAVARVRGWLDQVAEGALPQKIAIAAPDIEVYWPALASYLETEGIPTQKDHVRRLHSYPDISRWLAHLRLRTGAFAEADLETGLFASLSQAPRLMSYERFRTLYTALYDRQDLARAEEVNQRFAVEISTRDSLIRDDFVAWSLRQLPEEIEFQRVESLFRKLFSECPQSTVLAMSRWISYLEDLAAKVECRVRDGDPSGIACVSLSSAENSPADKMIILGLTEAALRQNTSTAILFSDVLSLAFHFGFHLASEDQAKLEFATRWVIESSEREVLLFVAETDFAGGVQAASWLWVQGARASGSFERASQISLPLPTRWEELQRAGVADIAVDRAWTSAQKFYLTESLEQDLGLLPLARFAQGAVTTLSPSAIEDYLDCPFIFAAKRLFRLSDMAELDLEVDPSRRGSLMHKLLEILTHEPICFTYTGEELADVVEKARTQSHLELADARLWAPLKKRYVDLARRFLEFEKSGREKFPETKTIGREFQIAGYLDRESGELRREGLPGDLKFIGTIDRVDEDLGGHLVIIDYKSSNNSVSQFASWVKNNQIQLLLYAFAIEKGLTILDPRPVLAALYYSVRPLNRDHGFKVSDIEQGLYETNDGRKRNRLTLQDKLHLFLEGEQLVQSAVKGILAGEFSPVPRDKKLCLDCQWSALCRAPHLNT